MNTSDLRRLFLNYFKDLDHAIVPSSSLVPGNDPTLLFTNAGMVPFKEVFLGQESRSYMRATSSQRCVRAGGKHNDLENVGYTARHHTFFEMLGNFSFGDYFKREAVQFAWEFLRKELNIPEERLWVTVYKDDQEAEDIWLKEMKVSPERFSRCGEKDNFWSMGDTGPCGPCSEIFYDHGPDIPGGPPGSPDQEADRYVEIWNLVFMQYNRSSDGTMKPLPKPSVDTGMGLERIAAVMQGVSNNYDIDLFQHLIQKAAKLVRTKDLTHTSLKVVADHIRSSSFLIVDGVTPANEGRGYVLRRIIRRAIRHGNKLGTTEPFFHQLVATLVKEMGDAYPELVKAQSHIELVLKQEEEQFSRTLEQGLKILEEAIAGLKDKLLPGKVVFKLYDTYGFPPDLTGDIARERDLELDYPGFEACMQEQRQRSKSASQFDVDYDDRLDVDSDTKFSGYQDLHNQAKITGIFQENKPMTLLKEGEKALLVLDVTPFYAEGGGQVGDSGLITADNNVFSVEDTRMQGQVHVHVGTMTKGYLKLGADVDAKVTGETRCATMLNHTATHLLHAALREILGTHVQQKGSLVDSQRLRFDFSHRAPVTPEEIQQLEHLVNEKIRQNLTVQTDLMSPEKAQEKGAMALFGEKYGEEVRVLSMGDFSMELCGGTHVNGTGEIGLFKITNETGIAAGIRRIEAVTGAKALAWLNGMQEQITDMASQLKVKGSDVAKRVEQLNLRIKELEKANQQLKTKLANSEGGDLAASAQEISGIKVLAVNMPEVDAQTLRNTLDQLKSKLGSAVVVLSTVSGDKVSLVAGVTKDVTKQVKAGELINFVATQVGGKGGGRPDMAQAGGTDPSALDEALKSVYAWVSERITGS